MSNTTPSDPSTDDVNVYRSISISAETAAIEVRGNGVVKIELFGYESDEVYIQLDRDQMKGLATFFQSASEGLEDDV